ncbi:hypothetical protein F8M41_019997 [Gigaspora margarita]|uniref:Uncharacterized protein n=1 Tax=Gigaspora margarita TaxID=4874 RepID=A0A8H4EJZ7_GIGMA|nr:hypothetical protein F8M41_019997 [Gigaspora margarita]
MLLKNDLTEFTDNIYTELKLKKLILTLDEKSLCIFLVIMYVSKVMLLLERHQRTGSTLWPQACNVCEHPFLNGNTLFGFHERHYILVYCNTNVKKKLEVYGTEQFLDIVDMLLQDNTVCIHVTLGPFSFLRVAALKYEDLPNNILFTTIKN